MIAAFKLNKDQDTTAHKEKKLKLSSKITNLRVNCKIMAVYKLQFNYTPGRSVRFYVIVPFYRVNVA